MQLSFFAEAGEELDEWIDALLKGLMELNAQEASSSFLTRKGAIRDVAMALYELSISNDLTDQTLIRLFREFADQYVSVFDEEIGTGKIKQLHTSAHIDWQGILKYSATLIDACDSCPDRPNMKEFIDRRRQLSRAAENLKSKLISLRNQLEKLEELVNH